MNQYPTLFLSLKDVDGTTFENAFNMLKFVISSLCSQNSYLETGENIRENEKDIFSRPPALLRTGRTAPETPAR